MPQPEWKLHYAMQHDIPRSLLVPTIVVVELAPSCSWASHTHQQLLLSLPQGPMWSSRQRASIPMWLDCQRLLPAYKLALHVNVPTCLACQGVIVLVFSSSAKRIHAENVTLSGFWDVLKIRYKICSKMTSQESPNYVSYEHQMFLGPPRDVSP